MDELARLEISAASCCVIGHSRSKQIRLDTPVRPFLKWAGGKQWLAPAAKALIGKLEGRYYEPFLGAGALFFALRPKRASLSDVNMDLVAAYEGVRDDVERVIQRLRGWTNTEEDFLHVRSLRPRSRAGAAARVIYLNKTAYSGLYRVSRDGRFNVPFGNYENPGICQSERLRTAAVLLRTASLTALDFERAVMKARSGDFVFLDPPYVTGHSNNGFLKYNAQLFSWADQERLARVARSLSNRGVRVLVSGPAHDAVLGLYSGFQGYRAERWSLVGPAHSRREIREVLISNFALAGVAAARLKSPS